MKIVPWWAMVLLALAFVSRSMCWSTNTPVIVITTFSISVRMRSEWYSVISCLHMEERDASVYK